MSTNYQALKSEILENILKGKNTSLLSKRLGFSFDKVARWKNGSKQLKWDEFCELCHHLKLPLKDALEALGFSVIRGKDELNLVDYLRRFHSNISTKELAKMLAVSPATFSRYVNQEAYPEVEFILEFIDLRNDILPFFVGYFFHSEQRKINMHFSKYPWMPAVANAALMQEFKDLPEHSSQWISVYLKIPLYQVEMAFEEFVKMGLIEKIGPHYTLTRQAPNSKTINLPRADDLQTNLEMIRYWTKKSLSFYDYDKNLNHETSRCMFRIFSCGQKNASKVNEILSRAEQEIHDLLIKNPEPPTDVRVFLLHHFSATGP